MADQNEMLHTLSDEWLSFVAIRGCLIYNIKDPTRPFKYADLPAIPQDIRCSSALEIKNMRQEIHSILFSEDKEAGSYHLFAGVQKTVSPMRCAAVALRLNMTMENTSYEELCESFAPCVFECFQYGPLIRGAIPETDYLGSQSYGYRTAHPDEDEFPLYTSIDRRYMMMPEFSSMTVHRGILNPMARGIGTVEVTPSAGGKTNLGHLSWWSNPSSPPDHGQCWTISNQSSIYSSVTNGH